MELSKPQLECELRGPITRADFVELEKRIGVDFGNFRATKELAIFIQGTHDLRIKITPDGGRLVYKNKIGINDYKQEIEVGIEKEYILNQIEILSAIGFNQARFSYVEKHEAKKGNRSFCVKFGSKIGDYFEIETLVSTEKDIAKVTEDMENYINQIGLQLWSQETYNDLLADSWKDTETEPLYDFEIKHFNQTILDAIEQIF